MKRISELDGVRGIAIILMLIWHYIACQIVADPKSFAGYCSRALSLTWCGVDLFFVLSGFLIAGILLDHRQAPNFFRVFYIRRICRIFPLYYLLLGLFICLMATNMSRSPSFKWLFHDPLPLWSYATFTQNIGMGVRGDFGANWLGITWSLAVEEQFYLVVPLLVYLLPRRALINVFVVAIFAAPLLRSAWPGFHAYVGTPWRLDSLLSGALLAVMVRGDAFLSAVRRNQSSLLALFWILFLGAAVMTVYPTRFGVLNYFWFAVLFATLILTAFNGEATFLGRMLGTSVLVWFGRLSYGLYMFHQAVCGLLYGIIRHHDPQIYTLSDAAITFVAFCITLALAAISYRYLETPILRLGHRFTYVQNRVEVMSLMDR